MLDLLPLRRVGRPSICQPIRLIGSKSDSSRILILPLIVKLVLLSRLHLLLLNATIVLRLAGERVVLRDDLTFPVANG